MQPVKARENMQPVKARENMQPVKARENMQPVKARENMQPVKARENSTNPTKFVLQFSIGGTCHTSTATNKIKRSNGICYPAQKTFKSETFQFVF